MGTRGLVYKIRSVGKSVAFVHLGAPGIQRDFPLATEREPSERGRDQEELLNWISFLHFTKCACVLSHFSHVQFFATLWTVACQAPLSMGFSRQEQWSGLPSPTLGDLPYPEIKPATLLSPALWGRFFTTSATWIPFSSVQSLSCVRLFVTSWTAAHQASLPITNSRSLLKLMSIESVMPSNHLILCHLLLLLPSIFPSIRVFSNESVLLIRWPKYWSFSFSISPSNEYSGLISFRMHWLDLLAIQGTLKSLQHHCSKASILWHSAFTVQLSQPPGDPESYSILTIRFSSQLVLNKGSLKIFLRNVMKDVEDVF